MWCNNYRLRQRVSAWFSNLGLECRCKGLNICPDTVCLHGLPMPLLPPTVQKHFVVNWSCKIVTPSCFVPYFILVPSRIGSRPQWPCLRLVGVEKGWMDFATQKKKWSTHHPFVYFLKMLPTPLMVYHFFPVTFMRSLLSLLLTCGDFEWQSGPFTADPEQKVGHILSHSLSQLLLVLGGWGSKGRKEGHKSPGYACRDCAGARSEEPAVRARTSTKRRSLIVEQGTRYTRNGTDINDWAGENIPNADLNTLD